LERNYLEVYPYDKWSTHELPNFQEGEEFMPSVCELREGATSKPALLTEADLVNLMDKNGIGMFSLNVLPTPFLTTGCKGTDATIAQHIQTIVDRGYVNERMDGSVKHLVPSKLGIGLVEGYNDIDFERSLSKPQLRREVSFILVPRSVLTFFFGKTEWNMVQVCDRLKTKEDMLEQAINQYKDMFIRARQGFGKVVTVSTFPSFCGPSEILTPCTVCAETPGERWSKW
jgi:DNA topoisomerase-3